MDFTIYILRCVDGSLYIGHTDDLDRRMEQHDQGQGCRYTSARRPVELIHAEAFETRYEALTMERKLKGWSQAKSWHTSPATGAPLAPWPKASTSTSVCGRHFDSARCASYAQRER